MNFSILIIIVIVIIITCSNIYRDRLEDLINRSDAIVLESKNESNTKSNNFFISGNKVVPITVLTEEQMKIQSERGCVHCHRK